MKEHDFKPVGYAMGVGRYRCDECGAQRLDNDPPHHFPTWATMSLDCNAAKKWIENYEATHNSK